MGLTNTNNNKEKIIQCTIQGKAYTARMIVQLDSAQKNSLEVDQGIGHIDLMLLVFQQIDLFFYQNLVAFNRSDMIKL